MKSYENYKMYKEISSKFSKNGSKKNFLNLNLTSSFLSNAHHSCVSRRGAKSSHNASALDEKAFSFYDDNMKPRYKWLYLWFLSIFSFIYLISIENEST